MTEKLIVTKENIHSVIIGTWKCIGLLGTIGLGTMWVVYLFGLFYTSFENLLYATGAGIGSLIIIGGYIQFELQDRVRGK